MTQAELNFVGSFSCPRAPPHRSTSYNNKRSPPTLLVDDPHHPLPTFWTKSSRWNIDCEPSLAELHALKVQRPFQGKQLDQSVDLGGIIPGGDLGTKLLEALFPFPIRHEIADAVASFRMETGGCSRIEVGGKMLVP